MPRAVHLTATAVRQIHRFAMLGTSLARRYSQRSGYNLPYVARTGGVISLVGTLVDTTAGLTELAVRPSDDERRRARELADSVARLQTEFRRVRFPRDRLRRSRQSRARPAATARAGRDRGADSGGLCRAAHGT